MRTRRCVTRPGRPAASRRRPLGALCCRSSRSPTRRRSAPAYATALRSGAPQLQGMLQPMMEDLFLARPSNPAEVRSPARFYVCRPVQILHVGRVGKSAKAPAAVARAYFICQPG